ncbi:hypothetical protein O0555_15470 [Brevibacillus laterosporus]|uniref:hypothetical protein n=1 Tax=Brevibacillus laterosporus TaxID=1465 RepID=UPI0018CE320E|nr:hypothetical protein [Brevibacillus laterosporus]MBG9788741.1 hypothetical protein [Brevibacillus laterosporus]MCR8938732.1 hypothetical protein [Brevibacillus laterosporus]MCZ0841372.1 hypothetical protein [Brevibacillus laterosporus]MCZ0847761.1 hypothetical protein [Brevibacillus laterosporus]
MTSDKIAAYLEQLASQLGTASGHVFELLVQQQVTVGIVKIAVLIPIMVLAWFGWRFTEKRRIEIEEANEGRHRYWQVNSTDETYWTIRGLSIVAIIVGALVAINGILHILNPEYYAILEIIDAIGGIGR